MGAGFFALLGGELGACPLAGWLGGRLGKDKRRLRNKRDRRLTEGRSWLGVAGEGEAESYAGEAMERDEGST